MSTESPSTATANPKFEFGERSESLSLSLAVNAALPLVSSVSQSTQPLLVLGLVNTYADPTHCSRFPSAPTSSSSSKYAPTTTVSPSTATADPNRSPSAGLESAASGAISLAVNSALTLVSSLSQALQPAAGSVNTYAAPACSRLEWS